MFTKKFLTKAAAVMTVLIVALSSMQPVLASPDNGESAGGTIAFQGELYGFSLPEGSCEDGVCTYTSNGYGAVNIMGAITVSLTIVWDLNSTPCSIMDPVEFTLAGPTGSIYILGSGYVCPDPSPNDFSTFSGIGEITGGSGEFSGIAGSVTIQGPLVFNGPKLHLSGSISGE